MGFEVEPYVIDQRSEKLSHMPRKAKVDLFAKPLEERDDVLRFPREKRSHWATLARDRNKWKHNKWKHKWCPLEQIDQRRKHSGDADESKEGGCAIAVRNDYNKLVEEFGSMSPRCTILRLRDRRGRKFWIVSAHTPTKTAVDNRKNAFCDELNAFKCKIQIQQVVIVGIDANAKMELEQQSDVLGKWHYPVECTSDNGVRLVDLCEQTDLIIASTFKRNHRASAHVLDYVLARNIPKSDIRESRAVWDVAFDTDHRPVLLSFKIRFHKRNRGVPLQLTIDMVGLKDEDEVYRTNFRQNVSIHIGVRTRKRLSDADSFTKCIQDAAKEALPVLLPRKKFAFVSAETNPTYNSVHVARSTGDLNQERRLRRKLRRQLQ
ncbi:hypothetical protein RB195_024319 [Necator americanus]|uniref:Endonuclease/exonuclease/phosphatase domain-containing protein n=1 Tax=Necator americanus TaxID=51031 RepID=A0ABR1EMV1_NECAM